MKKTVVILALSGCAAFSASAQEAGISEKQVEVINKLLATYEAQSKEEAKGSFKPFTAEAGRKFFLVRRTWKNTDPTCSSCHTKDPTKMGMNTETKEPIEPLAPAANPERFTDVEMVEDSFSKHCVALLGRHCDPHEKGNFITYLKSLKK